MGQEKTPRFRVAPRDGNSHRVIESLQNLYRKKLRPVEETYFFDRFHYDAITDTELEAKSQVLVIGQYSTGKTTFIRHLLEEDFPNMNIGPEPTTDKFTVVIHGQENRPVEGNSLALIKELPYEGLTRFGTGFLNKLDAAVSTSPFLENITLVDTPGVLSGEMQRHQRSYNFADVARWFADRSDMILILFDAHRLDVSDELMEILMQLKDHQSIIRIVLNKADQVEKAQLRRVYGALMWSMGKVFDSPEVVRVYLGSFWDKPLKHAAHERLFKADQESLTGEMTDLPRSSAIRKINQLIKRTNLVRAHACVMSYLSEQMPWMYGRARRREDLLNNMEGVLETVRIKHGLHEADMPDADGLRANLQTFDFASFPLLTRSALRQLSDVVDVDLHKVLKDGGGSEKIFKFSRNRPPPMPGLFSRAGTSVRSMFGGGGVHAPATSPAATAAAPATTAAGKAALPAPLLDTPPSSRAEGQGAAPETAGAGGGSSREAVAAKSGSGKTSGSGSERFSGGRGGWTCCSVLQVLLLALIAFVVLLLALEPIFASNGGGPLHTVTSAFTNQVERFLPQNHAKSVRRPMSIARFGEDGERVDGCDALQEVEALYKGTVH